VHTSPVTRILAAKVLAVVAALGLLVAVAAPAQAVGPKWRDRMLEKVNSVRAMAGVAPVSWCKALDTSAQRYAGVLARKGAVQHEGLDGTTLLTRITAAGYRVRVAGENLAGGQQTVVEVMRAWRASPGHLANLIDPRVTNVGFGYAESPSTLYRTYWVQHFGSGGSCG
jgi:uncharacterized protein YkwD